MKCLFLLLISTNAYAQQILLEDFTSNPLLNGWEYYNNGTSGTFDFSNQYLNAEIDAFGNQGFQSSFYRKNIGDSLSRYCVTFKITNKSVEGGLNSFFPLLLLENSPLLPNNHPWRLNAAGNTAGAHQSIGAIGVGVVNDEIRFVARSSTNTQNINLDSFSNPFTLIYNQATWVRLSYVTEISARLEVSANANFSNILRTQVFSMPDIEALTEFYISNGNGNWTTNVNYDLDDYILSSSEQCQVLGIENEIQNLFDFHLFPNPNNGSFNILINNSKSDIRLQIFDVLGKVFTDKIIENQACCEETFNLPSGTYYVRASNDENSTVKKMIVL